MTNTLNYKGYSTAIEFDIEDGIMFGKIAGIRDGVGFHGENFSDFKTAFREAVDDYLETCARLGKDPQKPYSGRVMIRVDPDLHRKAALAAELSGKSLNQWGQEAISHAVERAVREIHQLNDSQ